MAKYVTLNKFCSEHGYKKATIEGYIKNGVWLKYKQYRKPQGLILVDVEAYEKWVEEESELKRPASQVSKSRLPIAGSGVGRALRSSPLPLT